MATLRFVIESNLTHRCQIDQGPCMYQVPKIVQASF